MRAGADDIKGLRKRSAEGSGALQDGAERLDLSRGPMGDIGEGTVVDLAMETEGLAEEDGGRGAAVGDGRHIHVYILCLNDRIVNIYFSIYMPTYMGGELNQPQLNKRIQLPGPRNF